MWKNVRIRKVEDTFIVFAERVQDGVHFSVMFTMDDMASKEEEMAIAEAALAPWEDAPLKSPDQSVDDYLKSDTYQQYKTLVEYGPQRVV